LSAGRREYAALSRPARRCHPGAGGSRAAAERGGAAGRRDRGPSASERGRAVCVAHSGKLRAQQTAELLATALAPGTVPEIMTGLNPNDPVEPVARRVAAWTSDTILVGHLPFMGKLAARLVAGDELRPVAAFVPGTVVCLEQAEAGYWFIAWMVRPELAPLPV
jgi:phosphohistidine phosphatase SixA